VSCVNCFGTGYVFAVPIKEESSTLYAFTCTCSFAKPRAIPRWSKAAERLYKKTDFAWEVGSPNPEPEAKKALSEASEAAPKEVAAMSGEDDILKEAWTTKNWQAQPFRTLVQIHGKEWVKARIAHLRAVGYI
jgi:hypothetical protein